MVFALLFVLLSFTGSMSAQGGSLFGRIVDTSGAAVPACQIALIAPRTNLSRTARSNDSGNFYFADVPHGKYIVIVEIAGFKHALRETVDVSVNGTSRLDVTLEPKQVSSEVNRQSHLPNNNIVPKSNGTSFQPGTATNFSVKDFGAKGDGVSDDYDAMQAAATSLCLSPGSTLVFPAGTYRINRYRITGGQHANPVSNIRYMGCSGNTIVGYSAKIDVKGDFRRTADYSEGEYTYSYVDSVIPFEMINSSGFAIMGFEITGNVDQMTRDVSVAEGNNAGIFTTNCKDYLIKDVAAHHVSADGITIGGNSELADQRFRLDNVAAFNNARDGLSIIQARQGTITNSVFSNNGRTGKYGSHAPAAGADVEPERRPPQEDLYTGLLTFDNCRFEENLGSQFVSGFPELVDSNTVKNSFVQATRPDTSGQAFLNVPAKGSTIGNTFRISAGRHIMLGVDIPRQYVSIVHLVYDRNTMEMGDNQGVIGPIQSTAIDFTNNGITIQSINPDTTILRLDYMTVIENNHFFVAQTGYSGSVPTILYEFGNTIVRNNSYDTDLTPPRYFEAYYGLAIVPSGEVFLHPASFRPLITGAPQLWANPGSLH